MTHGAAQPLYVYNGGFLTQKRVRRILSLAGYHIRLGLPGPDDLVGVWGQSPTSHRGVAVAEKRDTGLLRVEDAFLRSLHPGRSGEPPIGLHLDRAGVHFDARTRSDLERLLATEPLDDSAVLNRARTAITRMRSLHLSKYSATDPDIRPPDPGYVLVVDQTLGDASVTACGADRADFLNMLVMAQEEHPGARVLIKTHPETQKGYRAGYFTPADAEGRVSLYREPISPWTLLEGAVGVYTFSSQLGFEAILAGHKPRVFGQPFYAGWGLTIDETPIARRTRSLTRAQLFAGAMIHYPTWYDPYRDCLCDLEQVIDTLEAQVNAWRQDRFGWVASGMRLWKRKPLQKVFGQHRRLTFADDPMTARRSGKPRMVWASRAPASNEPVVRVEDGFLRSRGLGAELVPPLSLVVDDLGIYYDPSRPSRLEHMISERARLRPYQVDRAEALITRLVREGVSKYNLGGTVPDLPMGHRVLVPGQVEDDASILTGAGAVRTNKALLEAARSARPNAVIIYKPHPDVEAGLRDGGDGAEALADVVVRQGDPSALLACVNEVWTITSLIGFEALLRGLPVTTLGAPFYAGWGQTHDMGPVPERRRAEPGLAGLVYAALIDYPRYFDPVTGLPCPVEVAVDRLVTGHVPHPGLANRVLSKLQGMLATHAHLWR